MENYENLTNEQLEQKMNALNVQFLEYQKIYNEALTNMISLGEEYDKIKKILGKRNNG